MEKIRQTYKEYKETVSAYQMALNTMYFDLVTIAPKKGIAKRNEAMAYLSGELFLKMTDSKVLSQIEELKEKTDDLTEKKEIELLLKSLEYQRYLPKEVYVDYQQILNDGQVAWEEAKHEDNYEKFEPYLKAIINKQKEVLTYLPKQVSDYDYLLDLFEEGTNIQFYDNFFETIKTHLVPLMKEIQEKGKKIDNSVLYQHFDIEQQKAYNKQLLEYLNMDLQRCMVSESEHPFTIFYSDQEARFTTHYYEDNIMSGILSNIHEFGHALYSLQLKPEYDGTALKDNIGSAMHESQSRLLENHLGRSRALWEVQFPILKQYFPQQFKGIELDQFMKMINVTTPSFIRTEADELTYPLHILIRYELEKEIFNGKLDLDKLETEWNNKVEEYLGIKVIRPSEGILQDMHWGGGSFGYFPTYALGSAYAAQFYQAMDKEINVAECLKEHQFNKIAEWLKVNIHQDGAFKTAEEIMKKATKEAFDPQHYIQYLTDKYRKIYGLD